MVRGESGLGADAAPPDVPGRDLEPGGDAGRGAEAGSGAACLVGEPVGDSGAVRWFPGSASGELVGGVKLLSRKRSEAPDDRRRRRSDGSWMSTCSAGDALAVDGRETEARSPPLGDAEGTDCMGRRGATGGLVKSKEKIDSYYIPPAH